MLIPSVQRKTRDKRLIQLKNCVSVHQSQQQQAATTVLHTSRRKHVKVECILNTNKVRHTPAKMPQKLPDAPSISFLVSSYYLCSFRSTSIFHQRPVFLTLDSGPVSPPSAHHVRKRVTPNLKGIVLLSTSPVRRMHRDLSILIFIIDLSSPKNLGERQVGKAGNTPWKQHLWYEITSTKIGDEAVSLHTT